MWDRAGPVRLECMELDTPLRHDRGFGARFNVIAAFAEEEDSLAALDILASTGAAFTLGLVGIALGTVTGLTWVYLFASEPRHLDWLVPAAGMVGVGGATIGLVVGGAGLGRRPGGHTDRGDRPEVAERDVLVTVQHRRRQRCCLATAGTLSAPGRP